MKEKQKVMGFGHRVYKKQDSRVAAMEACARKLSEIKKEKVWMDIYDVLVDVMKREKNIYPNLDLPAGTCLLFNGF